LFELNFFGVAKFAPLGLARLLFHGTECLAILTVLVWVGKRLHSGVMFDKRRKGRDIKTGQLLDARQTLQHKPA
jgi:hypothetical protein